MTKMFKISVIVVVIILTVFLIFSALQIKRSVERQNNEIQLLYSRKEELLLQQQKLEAFVQELNETLQSEIQKNNDLSEEVNTSTTTQTVNPPQAPTPQTPTTSSSSRVTRAS